VHIGGLALIARAHFVTGDRAVRLLWGPASDIELGPSRGATHCAVVATTLTRHSLDQYDLVLLGGGRAPQERASNVVTTYGLTETGSGVVYDGRALDGVDIAIVEGEIWVNSPHCCGPIATVLIHAGSALTANPAGSLPATAVD
jgi:O-succinylbenzoic acid--CoA ligase